jgi:protein-tyrosine phosphatase
VGSYPKSAADIQKLKEHDITAIFSIQSERDFKSHGLTPHYLSLLCQEHGVRYKRYSILDMNNDDFVSKAEGGVKVMRDLMRDGERVYVHCSAGIYRSPQMIALYLTLFERYSLEQAVSTVKANHPYAKPNSKVVRDAAGLIQLHRNSRAVQV